MQQTPRATLARVPAEALESLRDAVAGAQRAGVRVNMQWAFQRGMTLVQQELETYANTGTTFPVRAERELPRGRPRKSVRK